MLTGRAVLPERDAPWSLVRTLSRAALRAGVDPATALPPRLAGAVTDPLPELDAPSAALDPQTRRALLLEATVRLLAAVGGPLVLIDDLQWADASSLDALAVAALVAALVADAELAALLAEQTDGTPFAILEVIRSLVSAGCVG